MRLPNYASLLFIFRQPHLGAFVWLTHSCEATPGGSSQGQREAEQRRELMDASPQLQDLLSELRLSEVRTIQTDHDRRCLAQPPPCRRARDSEIGGNAHVPGAFGRDAEAGRRSAAAGAPVVVMGMIIGGSLMSLNSSRTLRPSADVRRSASMTTTRAEKCRMSVDAARLNQVVQAFLRHDWEFAINMIRLRR